MKIRVQILLKPTHFRQNKDNLSTRRNMPKLLLNLFQFYKIETFPGYALNFVKPLVEIFDSFNDCSNENLNFMLDFLALIRYLSNLNPFQYVGMENTHEILISNMKNLIDNASQIRSESVTEVQQICTLIKRSLQIWIAIEAEDNEIIQLFDIRIEQKSLEIFDFPILSVIGENFPDEIERYGLQIYEKIKKYFENVEDLTEIETEILRQSLKCLVKMVQTCKLHPSVTLHFYDTLIKFSQLPKNDIIKIQVIRSILKIHSIPITLKDEDKTTPIINNSTSLKCLCILSFDPTYEVKLEIYKKLYKLFSLNLLPGFFISLFGFLSIDPDLNLRKVGDNYFDLSVEKIIATHKSSSKFLQKTEKFNVDTSIPCLIYLLKVWDGLKIY